ncbi:Sepiapterin reductase [Chionoecetes opilio]|uniref:Sepiapterin reductase n=1 Tax=Chionoecetes opilio TaxID=41210 RepID=A0A8J4YBQ8_CHIOP|nr:Sepiapterin reductase [Chionoecetes opilio]
MSGGSSGSVAGPWWVVVTGASQGFGAAICMGLAPLLPRGSKLLGVARSQEGLTNTAAAVNKINPNATFISIMMDLETATTLDLEAALKRHLGAGQPTPPGQALVFHNAGSLGALKYLREMDDSAHASSYFNLNISSVIRLNAAFLRVTSALPAKVAVKIIHIISLAALEPFKSWGLYCTAKAGREMLFRVLAAENPALRVLSYSPGALDNDMQVKARTETQDKDIRDIMSSLKAEGKLLPCITSANKLLHILDKDQFKSGEHIDYSDA